MDLKDLTIAKAHEAMKAGEYTARELAEAYIENIKKKNKELNAFLEVYEDALAQADAADKMWQEGKAGPLTGIPFAIKDNILFEGHIASAASKILENYKAAYDATVIKELKDAGAVLIGRTNMDEFAMGSSTENSAFGPAHNPYDQTRVPGGSSGGSAIAVAADMALVALGTETCGSVREPSAFCGLVGLKPTYGALSRHGIIAMGNSLDQVSPFGKNVADVEAVFRALAKYDRNDSTSVPETMRKNAGKTPKKIGVPWHLFKEGVDPAVMENFKQSMEKFRQAGYEISDIELPACVHSLAAYYIIMPAEVSTNLARFDGIRYGYHSEGANLMEVYKKSRGRGFGPEARRRILLGTYVLSHGYYDAYYNRAVKLREMIRRELLKAFESVDLIATPTVPVLPFKIGEKVNDPVAMYLSDIFSAPANLSGVPSIALPSGFTGEGLPLSIQFMAPHWGEDALFEAGRKFESIR
jgi:aspartyl-tRNA(Asn)/glutamyl-tRNA(Gln) amidotransferase subunit A